MRRSELRVHEVEAIEGLLTLFIYSEQQWCQWDKLEDAIAEVDYDHLSSEYQGWFVEFLANCCMRVWRSRKEGIKYNEVKEEDVCIFIHNYDWNAFRFGKQKGLEKELTTCKILCIDKANLNDKEIKWLRSKCKCQG